MNFDPNIDPETQEQADAYMMWCAENFVRVQEAGSWTYRTATRASAWLLVCSVAPLHLDESVQDDRGALMDQLVKYQLLARAIERQRQSADLVALTTLRASLDCWEALGDLSAGLLDAAKLATSAMLLIQAHPLMDLWDLDAPDVWALLARGLELVGDLDAEGITYDRLSIRRNDQVTAKFTWQKVNNLARHMGAPPMSAN